MKRRNFIAAWLVTLLVPFRLRGADTIPVTPVDFITPVPAQWPKTAAKKALQWAAMCLRRGNHWTFEGIDWMVAKLPFMRNHLCTVHGHKHYEVDGMDRAQLVALHDAAHEGRSYGNFHFPPTPHNGMNRMPQAIMDTLPQSNCPGGVCPAPRRGLFGLRRG